MAPVSGRAKQGIQVGLYTGTYNIDEILVSRSIDTSIEPDMKYSDIGYDTLSQQTILNRVFKTPINIE